VAVDAGADAVKFQTFRAGNMYVADSGDVEYLDDEQWIYFGSYGFNDLCTRFCLPFLHTPVVM